MAVKTIVLRGAGIRKEDVTVGSITPGELVEIVATGAQRHGTAAGRAAKNVAVENELFGKEITVDYTVGEQLLYEALPAGAEFYGLLVASGAAVVKGSFLESAGDGSFRLIVPLIDSTTGTANATLVDGTGTYSQTIFNDNFADLAARISHSDGAIAIALEPITPGGSKTRCKMAFV